MSTIPDPTAVILARLEIKVDTLLAASGDHEARLRALEARRWPLPVVGAVSGVVSLLVSLIPMAVK